MNAGKVNAGKVSAGKVLYGDLTRASLARRAMRGSKWQSHHRALSFAKFDSRARGSAGGVPCKWVCQDICKEFAPNCPPPPSASTPHAPSMVVMQEGNIAQGMPRKRWGKKSPIGAKMSPIWG